MCDLLRIKTDRGAMIGDDQSGLSISCKPIYHFVVTSIFNGYAVIHFGCVAKINPESPLAKVCVQSCGILTGLDRCYFFWSVSGIQYKIFSSPGLILDLHNCPLHYAQGQEQI